MYSLYLESIKRRTEAERMQRERVAMKKREAPKPVKRLPSPPPPERSILRRTITPFPVGSFPPPLYSEDLPSLTKRDSTSTTDTELLSDTESMEDNDFDWDAFLSDEDNSFSYSIDPDDDNEKLNPAADPFPFRRQVTVDCPVPMHTSCKANDSLSLDSEDEDSAGIVDPDSRLVQVLPGLKLPLKGPQDSIQALEDRSNFTTTHCTCCEQALHCISSVTHVLCNECHVVSPVFSAERHRPSVGIGWTEEEFSAQLEVWQEKTRASVSSLPMPPLI